MSNLPFEISVNTLRPNRKKHVVKYLRILRDVPGKRCVYEALWNNRKVIAKVFQNSPGASRRLRKEWQGMQELVCRKINTPEPFFYGTTEQDQQVIVSEQIADSATAIEIYQRDLGKAGRFNLLRSIIKELAALNSKGVFQKDVHLGNFLVSDKRVFALDAGTMVFYPGPLPRDKSLKQLAEILCFLHDNTSLIELCREYASVRNRQFSREDETAVRKYMDAYLKRVMRKGLKKSLRTSKRCVRLKGRGYVGIFDRRFCEKTEPTQFIDKTGELMDAGTILKNGNTCYVSRINYCGMDLVVKRYNHKGFFHSLRHSLKGSRARRCWLHGHRLDMLQIATPKVLGLIERRKGPLILESYIVTEYVQGQKLNEILKDKNISREKRGQLKRLLSELITKLHRKKITHGDLKHNNILITDTTACVTDLDGMKVHSFGWLFNIRKKKDLASLDAIA